MACFPKYLFRILRVVGWDLTALDICVYGRVVGNVSYFLHRTHPLANAAGGMDGRGEILPSDDL